MSEQESGRIRGHLIDLSPIERLLFRVSESSPFVAQVKAGKIMVELAAERLSLNEQTNNGAENLANKADHELRVNRFAGVAGEILAYETEQFLIERGLGNVIDET